MIFACGTSVVSLAARPVPERNDLKSGIAFFAGMIYNILTVQKKGDGSNGKVF